MGKPLVMRAVSLAANALLTDAPSQPPTSTTRQKRPNAINPSPAEIAQLRIFELKYPPAYPLSPAPIAPICGFRGLPGFLSWPGLLLERTEQQRSRRARSPLASPMGQDREPEETPGPSGNGSVEQPG